MSRTPRLLTLAAFAAAVAALPAAAQDKKYLNFADAYNEGVRHVNAGRLAAAQAPLEAAAALAKNPRDKLDVQRALLIPYRELQEVGPMQKAAEYVIANTTIPAERPNTRLSLLSFVHKRGQMDAVIEGYEARYKKDPNDLTALFLLVEAYARFKEDPARAAELGEKLAAADKKAGRKTDVSGQAKLAEQYVKSGKLKEGAELFETIAPLDDKTQAWHLKEAAAAWLKAGDKAKAVAAAKKSAAGPGEKRSDILTYFWHRALGDVFLDAGEPKEAVPQYEQALAATRIEGYAKDTKAKLALAQAAAGK